MARISGVDLPRDKRVEVALTYIFGIGRSTANDILAKTGINPDTRVRDLTDEEVAKLREFIGNWCRLMTKTPWWNACQRAKNKD